MPSPVIWVELQHDDGRVQLVDLDVYTRLPASEVDGWVAHLFVRSASDERVDLGTFAELIRALRVTGLHDYRAAKVAR